MNFSRQIIVLLALAISGMPYASGIFTTGVPVRGAIQSGEWEILFNAGAAKIPVRMMADSEGNLSIVNDREIIPLDSIHWCADSFHVKLPLFQTFLDGRLISETEMKGQFSDPTRAGDYVIPFTAKYVGQVTKESPVANSQKFDVTFSPDTEDDRYKAVGLFSFSAATNKITGTFLTESGDYRFLEGKRRSDSLYLSCFDGAHLFYFTGHIRGDSITEGMFYSGKHWSEPWNGVLDTNAELHDPDSLTTLVNEGEPFEFTVLDLNGDTIQFRNQSLLGKVSIVQIFGSWCPNCTDETMFFKELFQEYSDDGLQVIPVGFERSVKFCDRQKAVEQQWKELNIPYKPYLAMGSGKHLAEKTFPMLNHVMSFPTSIIVDKHGVIRKIHTGFYGPGTGAYYYNYTDRLEMFVAQLLKEQ